MTLTTDSGASQESRGAKDINVQFVEGAGSSARQGQGLGHRSTSLPTLTSEPSKDQSEGPRADSRASDTSEGSHAPSRSKKRLKLPSLSTIFKASQQSCNASSQVSAELLNPPSIREDQMGRRRKSKDADSPAENLKQLENLLHNFGTTPIKPVKPKKKPKEKASKTATTKTKAPLFPWRQKKPTTVADLEQCFDTKDDQSEKDPQSDMSVKGPEGVVKIKTEEVDDFEPLPLPEKLPVRKSASLGSLPSKKMTETDGSDSWQPEQPQSSPAPLKKPSLPVKNTGKLHIMRFKGVVFVNEYALMVTLGQGSFGKVKLALNTCDSELYALKLIPKCRRSRFGGSSDEDIHQEIEVMKFLSHPNVVSLFEVIDDPLSSKMLLVMEFVEGSTLAPEEKKYNFRLTEIISRRYFRDILAGLDYLHSNNVSHGDMKPENLLTAANGGVKIADLGSSHFANGLSKKTRGTPAFMAPEMCSTQPFCPFLADVWALGACLYVMIFGEQPFKAPNVAQLYEAICKQPLKFPSQVFCSDSLKHLLRRLLEKDPKKRLSLLGAMEHQWVTHNGAHLLPNCRGLKADEELSDEAWLLESWPMDPVNFSFKALVNSVDDLLEHRSFQPGEYIVHQGDPFNEMYYIDEGGIEIIHLIEEDSEDDLDEDASGEVDDVASRTRSNVMRRVFNATLSAHEYFSHKTNIGRISEDGSGVSGPEETAGTFVARRGPDSVLVEAQAMQEGKYTTWRTSMRAYVETKVAVLNMERLVAFIEKHPEVELDIRALFVQRVRELQKLVMLETLSRLHSAIEDEVGAKETSPDWTRLANSH